MGSLKETKGFFKKKFDNLKGYISTFKYGFSTVTRSLNAISDDGTGHNIFQDMVIDLSNINKNDPFFSANTLIQLQLSIGGLDVSKKFDDIINQRIEKAIKDHKISLPYRVSARRYLHDEVYFGQTKSTRKAWEEAQPLLMESFKVLINECKKVEKQINKVNKLETNVVQRADDLKALINWADNGSKMSKLKPNEKSYNSILKKIKEKMKNILETEYKKLEKFEPINIKDINNYDSLKKCIDRSYEDIQKIYKEIIKKIENLIKKIDENNNKQFGNVKVKNEMVFNWLKNGKKLVKEEKSESTWSGYLRGFYQLIFSNKSETVANEKKIVNDEAIKDINLKIDEFHKKIDEYNKEISKKIVIQEMINNLKSNKSITEDNITKIFSGDKKEEMLAYVNILYHVPQEKRTEDEKMLGEYIKFLNEIDTDAKSVLLYEWHDKENVQQWNGKQYDLKNDQELYKCLRSLDKLVPINENKEKFIKETTNKVNEEMKKIKRACNKFNGYTKLIADDYTKSLNLTATDRPLGNKSVNLYYFMKYLENEINNKFENEAKIRESVSEKENEKKSLFNKIKELLFGTNYINNHEKVSDLLKLYKEKILKPKK